VQLTLNQALHAVAHRHQTVPVDGLYSILGLLPYGKDVTTNYKGKLCLTCQAQEKDWYETNKQSINCQHDQRTKFPTYFVKELNKELKKMMGLAVKNGTPYEPLS